MTELQTLIGLQDYDTRIAGLESEAARLPREIQALHTALDEAGKAACALHRKNEVQKEREGLDFVKEKAGVQVNEVRDLRPFQSRMGPVYEFVASKVGKEFMDRLMAAARAAE